MRRHPCLSLAMQEGGALFIKETARTTLQECELMDNTAAEVRGHCPSQLAHRFVPCLQSKAAAFCHGWPPLDIASAILATGASQRAPIPQPCSWLARSCQWCTHASTHFFCGSSTAAGWHAHDCDCNWCSEWCSSQPCISCILLNNFQSQPLILRITRNQIECKLPCVAGWWCDCSSGIIHCGTQFLLAQCEYCW